MDTSASSGDLGRSRPAPREGHKVTTLVDRRAALIVVDLERGVIPYVDASTASSVVANAARLAAAFRDTGRLVVLTVQHPGGPPGRRDAPRAATTTSSDFTDFTDFTDLVPELDRRPTDLLVNKSQWGAITGTGLHDRLQAAAVTQVVLCGIATSMGVETTARTAWELGYNVLIVGDATADPSRERDEHSRRHVFPLISQIRDVNEVIAHCGDTSHVV